MKIMFYALRPFDEQQYCEPYKARYGIDYTGTPDVPRPDNPVSYTHLTLPTTSRV
mgnify:CR=1 FL=1